MRRYASCVARRHHRVRKERELRMRRDAFVSEREGDFSEAAQVTTAASWKLAELGWISAIRAARDNDTGIAVCFFRGRSMTRPRSGELEKGVLSWDTSRHAIRCNLQGRTGVVDTNERDGE